MSGRYWIRGNENYREEPREELIEEKQFSEFNPKLKGTYFEEVYSELKKRFLIGRMRILSKGIYNCNSWHRDPEPRIHIPIKTNPRFPIYCKPPFNTLTSRWLSLFHRYKRIPHSFKWG